MVHGLTYSTVILDTFGVLSSFNFADKIWEKYEQYAIPKIEDATLKIRGSVFYIKDISPKQAEKELKSLNQLIPILHQFQEVFESNNNREFKRLKKTVLEFFEALDLLHDNLQDVAKMYSSYQQSIPVLAEDWDRSEDDHWDNY